MSTVPRQSTTSVRGPPVIPPGMPVRADATATATHKQQSTRNHHHHHQHPSSSLHHTRHTQLPNPHPPTHHAQQPHQAQQRMSMPPPRSTTRPMPPPANQGPLPSQRHRYPAALPSSGSSSPNDASLRDSTRHNISRGSSRDTYLETPKSHKNASTFDLDQKEDINAQFEQLMENLQVADSVREKFQTVSLDVKSSILDSSTNSNPNILNSLGLPLPPQSPRIKKRMSTPLLRNVRSSASIKQEVGVGGTCNVGGDEFIIVKSPLSPPLPSTTRGQSFDMPRASPGRPTSGPRPISGIFASSSSAKGLGISMGEQPDSFINWLKSYKGTDLRMEVDRMKKLRMLLRHESTGWVQTFLDAGGYELILARLQDLLDIEWR